MPTSNKRVNEEDEKEEEDYYQKMIFAMLLEL
jgi:hypothetical protein